MAPVYPSSTNTFIPNHEMSGGLIVGYSKNPKKFKLNKYIKLIPVKSGQGFYLTITAEEAARVVSSYGQDYVWQGGQEAPMDNDGTESFQFTKFLTTRYCYGFNLDQKGIDQATWDIVAVNAGNKAQQAMTNRTQLMMVQLTTAGNWGSNTGTATAAGGGAWDFSGPTDKFIRRAFDYIAEQVLLGTLGVVNRDSLICVVNPHDATKMAESEEIRDYLKQSPFARAELEWNREKTNNWGLPSELYGIDLVVEDCVRVTSLKGAATKTTAYAMPTTNAIFLSRPGGLEGMQGIQDFSTAQIFMYEDMTVETLNDVNNRRVVGRVVDDFSPTLVTSLSGWYLTGITST